MVTLWLPKPMAAAVNEAIEIEDTDRSKFIRRAVRDKLRVLGIQTKEAA